MKTVIRASKYILLGILFGIILTKSEAVSWFRIQEMFRFQSFHMYGIIGTAVGLGALLVFLIKKFNIKDIHGQHIQFVTKNGGWFNYLVGGTIFGLGWALTGACPGPIFVLIGQGVGVFWVILLSAIAGTYVYGLLRERLPH